MACWLANSEPLFLTGGAPGGGLSSGLPVPVPLGEHAEEVVYRWAVFLLGGLAPLAGDLCLNESRRIANRR